MIPILPIDQLTGDKCYIAFSTTFEVQLAFVLQTPVNEEKNVTAHLVDMKSTASVTH